MPRSACRATIRVTPAIDRVLMLTWVVPFCMVASRPSGPCTTAVTALSSASIEMTIAAPAAASRAVATTVTPCTAAAFSGDRFHSRTA
jgi:hypothetical protein